MKTYACDSCKTMIDNPHKVKMKEFYYAVEYDWGLRFPVEAKTKQKIHLCDKCFLGLRTIAERKGGEENV